MQRERIRTGDRDEKKNVLKQEPVKKRIEGKGEKKEWKRERGRER